MFKTLDINIFQLLILLGSFQALIFSLIIFFNKRYNTKINIFLGLMVFFTALSNLEHMIIDMGYWEPENALRKIYVPFQWLILPMFYMHVHVFLKKRPIAIGTTIILLAPFFLVLFTHLGWFIYHSPTMGTAEMPDYYDKGHLLYSNLASCIYNSVVLFMIYRMIVDYIKDPWSKSAVVKKKVKVYKSIILLAMVAISVASGTLLLDLGDTSDNSAIYYPFFILISIFVYWIGYAGVSKNEFERSKQPLESPLKSGGALFSKINSYIIDEQKYLDANLNLETIARKFDISPGYLSKLVNTHSGKSFINLVNEKRVATAKKMINDLNFRDYTFESIGLESGFKSKSNFYAVFKKFTGRTPNQYRKEKNLS